MVEQKNGLIVNLLWAAKYKANVALRSAKAAVDKMTADMAHEAEQYRCDLTVSGLVRTEMPCAAEMIRSNSSRPVHWSGHRRTASDPIFEKAGGLVGALSQKIWNPDIDGKQPRPVTLEEA
jgi:hypothetical protein